jgi:uncharacterized protein (DUF58 family)
MQRWGRFVVLIVFWSLSLVYGLWQGGEMAWFLSYSLGFLIIYLLSFLALALHSSRSSITIDYPEYCADDDVWVTVHLQQKSWIPLLWLAVRQDWENQARGQRRHHRHVVFSWFKSVQTYRYKIESVKRGEYRTEHLEIVTGDVFGFVVKSKQLECSAKFVVFPRPLSILPGFIHHRDDADMSVNIRNYMDGDPMNRIDWKTTARTDVLKTRETDQQEDKRWIVYLDAGESSYLSGQPVQLFEKSVQVAASLLHYAKEYKLSVGVICSNKQGYRVPVSSKFPYQDTNTFLAAVCADGTTSLHQSLWNEAHRIPANTTVLCVTAHVDDELINTIRRLRAKRIELHVLMVYSAGSMTWHQQQLKQQLESMGGLFYGIQYAEMNWDMQGGVDHAGA